MNYSYWKYCITPCQPPIVYGAEVTPVETPHMYKLSTLPLWVVSVGVSPILK